MEEMTRRVRAYLVHDAINNMEGYITDYSTEALQAAQESGLIIIAEYNDGSRDRVNAADVVEPQPEVNGVTLVQPSYVDDRMEAAADVFDALQALLLPEAAALAYDAYAASSARDPAEAFKEALARFKALSLGGDAA